MSGPRALSPYRWFGRDRPSVGWERIAAATEAAWGLSPPPARSFPEIAGPLVDSEALWRALGAADEASLGSGRSIAVPYAALSALAEQFSAALGAPVAPGALAARWADDLRRLAEIAPGQPRDLYPPPLDVLAMLAERGVRDEDLFAPLLEDKPLPEIDTLPAPPIGGAIYGLCRSSAERLVVARVRCAGPCWLLASAPFAYYTPLATGAGALALPSGLAEAWFSAPQGPEHASEEILSRIPASPMRWRTDFWLSVLARVEPAAIAWAIGVTDEAIARFADSLRGTPLLAPLLAASGERALLQGDRDPDRLLSLAKADPRDLSPSDRARAIVLEALSLDTRDAVVLFLAARDLHTGDIDLHHPSVDALVRRKIREALLAEPQDLASFDAALSALSKVGGDLAAAELLDGLLYEGITTAGEIVSLSQRLSARARQGIETWRRPR